MAQPSLCTVYPSCRGVLLHRLHDGRAPEATEPAAPAAAELPGERGEEDVDEEEICLKSGRARAIVLWDCDTGHKIEGSDS